MGVFEADSHSKSVGFGTWLPILRKKSLKTETYHAMGRLRLVGSLKSYVSFAIYSLLYRALLQKTPIILRSLLIVAHPYRRYTPSPPALYKGDIHKHGRDQGVGGVEWGTFMKVE